MSDPTIAVGGMSLPRREWVLQKQHIGISFIHEWGETITGSIYRDSRKTSFAVVELMFKLWEHILNECSHDFFLGDNSISANDW